MRVLVAVCAILALSACNWVTSNAPLFSAADAVGAPQLRSGVWSAGSSVDCAVDEKKPITDWPDCGGRLVVKNSRWMMLDKQDGRWVWTTQQVVLTAGTPAVLQVPSVGTGKDAKAGYSYYGVRAGGRDSRGRITSFKMWPVLCGPPSPTPKAGEQPVAVHPFPGMTMDASDSDCTTPSREAVRSAADASQLWSDPILTAHWVRAGDR